MNLIEKEHKFKDEYNEWAQPLFRFIFFKSKNKELAQDIVQDTFVKYWDKIESICEGKGKSYLFTTAKNLFLNYIEHQKVISKHQELKPVKDEILSPNRVFTNPNTIV